MGVFQNKHVKLAMLISPGLAIVAYVAVDYAVSERPAAASRGRSYPLAAKSNCRYTSGLCTLKNGDVELKIRATPLGSNRFTLKMTSELSVEKAILSFSNGKKFSEPKAMERASERGLEWSFELALDEPSGGQMRLAVTIAGAAYFAETSAIFVQYESAAAVPAQR